MPHHHHSWKRLALLALASLAGPLACETYHKSGSASGEEVIEEDNSGQADEDDNPGQLDEDDNAGPAPSPTAVDPSLQRFDSCEAFEERIAEILVEKLALGLCNESVGEDQEGLLPPCWVKDQTPRGSATNGQEADSDVAAAAKTEGDFLYVADLIQGLVILRAQPADGAERIAALPVDGLAKTLLVQGDRALVFSDIYPGEGEAPLPFRSQINTRATLINLDDPQDPRVVRQIDLEGRLVHARLVGGRAHLAVQTEEAVPNEFSQLQFSADLSSLRWGESPDELRATLAQARELLRPKVQGVMSRMPIETWLPLHRDALPSEQDALVEPLLGCDQALIPATASELGVLGLVSLDLGDDEAALQTTGLYSNQWQLYTSQDHLYAAQNSDKWFWSQAPSTPEVHVHKFSQGEALRHEASGAVPGVVVGASVLSEHDGHLRVFTTRQVLGRGDVYVMDPQLQLVGQTRGLIGQRSRTVVMSGERGCVSSFEQDGPLVALDLSDPSNPRAGGELTIGSFDHLQALGEGRILALGLMKNGDSTRGVLVRLLDASDPAAPRVLQSHDLMAAPGELMAVSLKDKVTFEGGVLSFPADIWRESTNRSDYFSGALFFSVDAEQGIEELGRVDHSDLALRAACPEEEDNLACLGDFASPWKTLMFPSIHAEDHLLSISAAGLKVSDPGEPSRVLASVPLRP